METIINKAIEGGFMPQNAVEFSGANNGRMEKDGPMTIRGWSVWNLKSGSSFQISHSELICDPLFFQALGKACSSIGIDDAWYTTKCDCGGIDFHIAGHDAHHPECSRCKASRGWLFNAKKFHELNLTVSFDAAVKYLLDVIGEK